MASALAELRGDKANTFKVLPPAALAAERTRKKLSAFPPLQVPTALAVGTDVAATADSEPTKRLFGLLALVVLFGTSLQVVQAWVCTTKGLILNLARTFKFFGLRDYVSWAFSVSGDISSATSSLADFRQATSSSMRFPAPKFCLPNRRRRGRSTYQRTFACAL